MKISLIEPNLPKKEALTRHIEDIWESKILSNQGVKCRTLEKQLKTISQSQFSFAVSNGSVAIELALKALRKKGRVMASPFTWVSTISSIYNTGNIVDFIDIDEQTLNIDPNGVQSAVTEDTIAILATHVFGNPCDIEALEKIAADNGLALIFDAAHAVGTKFNNQPVLKFGDMSCISMHPTKVISTGEGGAIFTNNEIFAKHISQDRVFGFNEDKEIVSIGGNYKLDEISASLAIESSKLLPATLSARKDNNEIYRRNLASQHAIKFQKCNNSANFSYFPIIPYSTELSEALFSGLTSNGIECRRYFSPSLNLINAFTQNKKVSCPKSEYISSRVLVLPSHSNLKESDILEICDKVSSIIASHQEKQKI